MLYREIEEKIKDFFQTEKKSALMITGARQVGKHTVSENLQKKISHMS